MGAEGKDLKYAYFYSPIYPPYKNHNSAWRHNVCAFGATFQPLDKSEGVSEVHHVGHCAPERRGNAINKIRRRLAPFRFVPRNSRPGSPDDAGGGNCSARSPADGTCSVTSDLEAQCCTHVGSHKSACGFCNWYGAEVLLLEQAIREPLNPSEILKITLKKNFGLKPGSLKHEWGVWREKEPGFAQTKMADMAPRSYKGRGGPSCRERTENLLASQECCSGKLLLGTSACPLARTHNGKKRMNFFLVLCWEFSFVLYFYRKMEDLIREKGIITCADELK